MLRFIVAISAVFSADAECQPGDAICRDQELPSNSLLQRDKRALGKELSEERQQNVETLEQIRARIAKELNSENFTLELGQCTPGSTDAACCFMMGPTCTNPPNPMNAMATSCPLGALCTAPLSVPFAGPPSYGMCRCEAPGFSCATGQCSFSPFGQSAEVPAPATPAAMTEVPAPVPATPSPAMAQESEHSERKFFGSCSVGTKDASCCMARGPTCTNPPNPFDSSTFCPKGAACTASFNVNPFAAPTYGHCQCQLGAACASDGNSCASKATTLDPFFKCTGGADDPDSCCPTPKTCTNPPMVDNFTATSCALGQACDADPTLFGGTVTFGTCKCLVGSCGSDGQCQH